MPEQICFPTHDPIPHRPSPPTIDGFVDTEPWMANDDFGVDPDLADTGWASASRVTFLSASESSGLGTPSVVFQGIKENGANYISLGFVVRRDAGFDGNDVIVLVFHPTYAAGSPAEDGNKRRIDIFPNVAGTGVPSPTATSTIDFGTERWQLRENDNALPRANFYRWNATTSVWEPDSAATPSKPNNITVRARSWQKVDPVTGTPSPNQRNWSVEIRLPTNTTEGGTNWINLTSNFGFYFNVIRVLSDVDFDNDPTTPGISNVIQFPLTSPTAAEPNRGFLDDGGGVFGLNEIPIPRGWLAEALLGAASCTGGVRFKNGSNSAIGIKSSAAAPITDPLSYVIEELTPNIFAARIENLGTAAVNNVRAEFRIANWGIGPGGELRRDTTNKWNSVPATGGTSNPTGFVNVGAGATVEATMQWTLTAAERALYSPTGPLDPHQCIWVRLDAAGNVYFSQSSIARNMQLDPMSEVSHEAEISGDGFPPPYDGGADQEFLLLTSQMVIARRKQQDRPGNWNAVLTDYPRKMRDSDRQVNLSEYIRLLQRQVQAILQDINNVEYRYIWITDGFRKNGLHLTINGTRYPVYEPIDSFGVVGSHVGPVSGFEYQLTETPSSVGRLNMLAGDLSALRVPDGGAVRIGVRLAANESPVDILTCRMIIVRWLRRLGPLGQVILKLLGWA